MARKRRVLVLLVTVLLLFIAAVSAGMWLTSGADDPGKARRRRPGVAQTYAVDQQPLQSAQQLEKLVASWEEFRLARQARRTADHLVDMAFMAALRDLSSNPPAQNPETKPFYERVREAEKRVQQDEQLLQKLTSAYAASKGARADELLRQIPLAQAELVLHQGELEDGKRALRRAGGDPGSRIQQLFNQHQAVFHREQEQAAPPPAFEPFQVPGTLLGQLRKWQQLRHARQQVQAAQRQATSAAASLESKREELAAQVQQLTRSSEIPGPAANNSREDAAYAAFDRIAEKRKFLAEAEDRIQGYQQLAQIYSDWSTLIAGRIRACIHAVLQSALWILLIVLFVTVANMLVARASLRLRWDRRHVATLRLLGRFAVQAAGLLLILLVLLGSPSQLSTILAFAGAGLTVALKDFIVAFLGWFVLMGKHGIHIGDWVEINGISGEVAEIGLFRTVLLETGNWADSGHPTGRRVTFVNSFAIEGHYFNFSTTGQWLWDSLEVLIPAGQDPYPITDAILKLVLKETEANVRQAEKEWQRAAQQYGVQAVSAVPAINLRPTFQGINVVVRYITGANERYEVRTRLYERIVELLHRRNITPSSAPGFQSQVAEAGQTD
jgi:small-conductance mechanosensitive channel